MKTRFLIGLMIVMMILPIGLTSFKEIANINIDYYEIDDEIMIYKLRRILLISYNLEIINDELFFRYQGKDCELYLNNGHLILTPGTLIFLEDIDFVNFEFKNDYLYMKYERKGKKYEKVILSKRLCIDIFYDDVDDIAITDNDY